MALLIKNLLANTGDPRDVREGHEFEQAPGVDDGQGKPDVLQSMGSQSTGHD